MKTHGNCTTHQFRVLVESRRSIGRVIVESCNNCLSVVVTQERDTDSEGTETIVEMRDSAYPYVP
jgi:hypothetical protein